LNRREKANFFSHLNFVSLEKTIEIFDNEEELEALNVK
jgi:hypothetical protein